MPAASPVKCEACGVLDALDRHDPMCPHALSLGLVRLAEGEDPIDPAEDVQALTDSELEAQPEDAELESLPAVDPARPLVQRVAGGAPGKRGVVVTDLWFSYGPGDGYGEIVVHESELEALRYAVLKGHKARRLELGRSVQAQVEDAG